MEAIRFRNIKSGAAYEHLFQKAKGNTHTVKRSASLSDTLACIPKVVHQTLHQTTKLATLLKRNSVYETCSNIWDFVYRHIQYRKDRQGYEQIRSPARAWHDRRQGVDCDCYSVFISSVLVNLRIPHMLRITKYRQDHFQHIYPVVVHEGKEIPLDCVTDQFDYEVPYSEKKDYPMELQFLDGFAGLYGDANEIYLMGTGSDMDELGKLIGKNMAAKKLVKLPVIKEKPPAVINKIPAKKAGLFQKVKTQIEAAKSNPPPASVPATPKPKKKGFLKKVLNVVNKVNPATVLLRNGVLAAMKLNVKNVAGRLRWSYVSADKIAAKGIDPAKFQRLVATRQKLENIFYGAGGKPDNLRNAIISGKGNKDKAVNGLGMLSIDTDYLSIHTPLDQLLGPEMYYSENMEGLDGLNALDALGELGEPVTLATVGAAMGVISGIVASLKQIGNIFKGKQQGSEDFDEKLNEAAENNEPVKDTTPVPPSAPIPSIATNPILPQNQTSNNTDSLLPGYNFEETATSNASHPLPASPATDIQDSVLIEDEKLLPETKQASIVPVPTSLEENAQKEKPGFWEDNKKWLKPTLMVSGGIAVIAIGFKLFKDKNKSPQKNSSLSGWPQHKKKKKNYHRKQKRKIAIALV